MKIIKVQFSPWDKVYFFDAKDCPIEKGDLVLVKPAHEIESGEVISVEEADEEKLNKITTEEGVVKPILRKANLSDLERIKEKEKKKEEALETCAEIVKTYNLPMKVVDVRFSFDGRKVVFAFTSKERIDFRDLVKELIKRFQKSVRLQQISSRGEVKSSPSIGPCGRELCCGQFLQNLGNVTMDKVYTQQVASWGAERLSGICGRLKCCLGYEEELYKQLTKNMPAMGSVIKTKQGAGKIIGWQILKQTVKVELDKGGVIEVPIKN